MTTDISLLLVILVVTMILFVTELLRVDIIAILAMLALGWTGLLTPAETFSGFSSNAVISVIAVMILGYGIEKSGLMRRVSGPITRMAGGSENRLVTFISLAVGGISSFMQNIGAAAIFLPVLRKITREVKIPLSRLLMPMGFAAILGGTLTMVGSSPMILLNDLLINAGIEPYHLFSSTPIGLTLLLAGIFYYLVIGKHLLPKHPVTEECKDRLQKLIDTYNIHTTVYLFHIPKDSPLIGKTREEAQLWKTYRLNVLALSEAGEVTYAPWRMTRFTASQEIAVMGEKEDVARFFEDYNLHACNSPGHFRAIMNPQSAGFAEVIIPPGSGLSGKSLRQIAFRKTFDVEPMMLIRGTVERRGDYADIPLRPGDTFIVYGLLELIKNFEKNEDVILSASTVDGEPRAGGKGRWAAGVLALVVLGVAAGIKLPVVLMTGALALVFTKVITIDEAYRSVDWRTVFLLAGLIPLGIAMEKTGAAVLVADQMMALLQNSPVFIVLLAVAVLSTLFTLFMSNAAATVLLVPLAINIARTVGIDPAAAAMLVAICAANSFILPTHQVNAFLMSPGGYHTRDYIKAGGLMTLVFLFTAVGFVYFFFL